MAQVAAWVQLSHLAELPLGMVESFVYGISFARVFAPLYNFFHGK
jgi:hypothetical protein